MLLGLMPVLAWSRSSRGREHSEAKDVPRIEGEGVLRAKAQLSVNQTQRPWKEAKLSERGFGRRSGCR